MATEAFQQTKKGAWFEKRAPEMAAKWGKFHDAVYETGQLDRKTKELIAVAASTTYRCVHCTRSHIETAQAYGASKEEVAEALIMAGLLASGTQLFWMLDDYEELLGTQDQKTPWFIERTEAMGRAWRDFYDAAYDESALDRKTKELLAASLGAVGRCTHCTGKHIDLAQEFEASKEEVAEAILVAALIASGTQFFWMIKEYERLLG